MSLRSRAIRSMNISLIATLLVVILNWIPFTREVCWYLGAPGFYIGAFLFGSGHEISTLVGLIVGQLIFFGVLSYSILPIWEYFKKC
jgi:hypothetical protein